ncbi:helix-turn-helix transcriptional regulator [Pseudohaliea rubra]|uniref:Transcriptional regulator, LuxR family protein n=1 Tax=Pseudohaliea rubra DSM 19751 TaxID=1265313 RepID=A0A095VNC5_9GAMM|nr:LuxR C-terminal-related transcriptional regulator [Pseudohaliea rubra]KGE02578.1 transcriptional regulator, LuxR family protein [Pseudohaliea rubra DSM 19751]
MIDPAKLGQWHLDLSRAIDSLGSDDFFPALVAAVRNQVPVAYPQFWLYHRELPPQVLYHEIPANAVAAQVDRYLEGPYREDPFFRASMNRPKSSIYRLTRLTAGRLEESAYYRDYYAETGTVDEAVFLARLPDGDVINLSMMRLPKQGPFSEDEYQRLYLLAEPVAALLRRHTGLGDFAVRNLIQPGIDHQVELAFSTFGASVLSPREKDVLELMLRGYSTDVSAQRLSIARETLRRHRKNIYKKLDVSSQTDLFALFINSMSCLAEAAGEDPLRVYMGTG